MINQSVLIDQPIVNAVMQVFLVAKKSYKVEKYLRIKFQIINFLNTRIRSLFPRLSPENEANWHSRSRAHLELTSLMASFASLMLAGLIKIR